MSESRAAFPASTRRGTSPSASPRSAARRRAHRRRRHGRCMADLRGLLKSLALSVLPDGVLRPLKRRHYLGVVRSFDSAEAAVMRALLRPGEHAVDLGANVGWYTRVLSEAVGASGRVYSVEPIPETFGTLRFCVRRLHLDNVVLFDCAVSDRDATAVMEVPRYDAGGENYYQARIVAPAERRSGLRRITVAIRSVDSLVGAAPGPVAFVKCDVEGHEAAVVRGARALIARRRPSLCLEISGDPDAE